MVMFVNNFDVLIQSEDRACEQERLRHIIEQSASHVVDLDHLIRHQRDAAHDEQHRAGVPMAFVSLLLFYLFTFLHHRAPCCAEDEGDDVTDRLKDRLYRLVHNFPMF